MNQNHAPQRIVTARLVRRDQDDGSFDREFWGRLSPEARFAVMWEMVGEAEWIKGRHASESRLQRSVETVRRREG